MDTQKIFSPEVHVGWIIGLLITIFGAGITMYSKVNSLIDERADRHQETLRQEEATRRELDSLDRRVGNLESWASK